MEGLGVVAEEEEVEGSAVAAAVGGRGRESAFSMVEEGEREKG